MTEALKKKIDSVIPPEKVWAIILDEMAQGKQWARDLYLKYREVVEADLERREN